MSVKTKTQLLAEIKDLQKRLAELQEVEAESHHKKQAHALGERVKEINCLYSISKLVETPNISLPEILQGSVNLLPPSLQYPHITCARITLGDQEYKTGNFRETKWKLANEIKVEGKRAGAVEVFYFEEQSKSGQSPFLKEKHPLIDAVAKRLGRIILLFQTQQSLLETSNYLKNLFTCTNASMIVWDPSLKITRFNRAFEQLTGYSANELLGRDLSTLFPETNRAESLSKITGTVSGEHRELIEIPILHKGGKARIVLCNPANIYAEDGKEIQATIAQGLDITERKRGEKVLQESEEKFKRIVMTSQEGIWMTDAQMKIIFTNARMAEILGYSVDELMRHQSSDFIFDVDRPDHDLRMKSRIKGVAESYECRLKHKNGSALWTIISASPLFNEKGEFEGTIAMMTDITERKQAAENLRKKDEHHKAVIENIFKFVPEGLLVFTKNRNLLKQNKAFEEIVQKYAERLGYTEEELAEKIIEQIRGKILDGDTTEIHIPRKDQ